LTGLWERPRRLIMRFETTSFGVLRQAARAFRRDRARRLSAGLAYYSLFALVPTLMLAAAIAAAVVGREATEGGLSDRLDDVTGTDLATQIESAVASLWENTNASGLAIVSVSVVVYSASVLFIAWRDTLEALWAVPYRPGLTTSLRARAFGVLVPIGAGLLLTAILLSEMIVALARQLVSSPVLDVALRAVGATLPMVLAVLALAVLYRHTTRLRPAWADVWPGTCVAALAMTVLSWGYGVYIRLFGASSVAGAAGSVVLALVFVYYCAQVLLFGAEVISSCADHRGRPMRRVSVDDRAGADRATRPPAGR